MRTITFLILLMLTASHSGFSQEVEDFFGSYIYAEQKISLNLSPPDAYTLFQMEQDRRTGAVTSKEISRGTFAMADRQVVLEEFPTRQKMYLEVDSEMTLQTQDVKGVEAGAAFRAWSKQHENGQTRMEGSWRKGKRHGTWVYYNEEGDVIRSENYRRGKLKN